jgi:hypothetical protein
MKTTSLLSSQISMKVASEALKAEQFWAEMRSTAYLFSKSTWPTAKQTANLISELGDILGKRILIYPKTFAEFGIGPQTPYSLKRQFLGLGNTFQNPNTEECDQRFLKFMANKASQAQKANWTWRITQEAKEKQNLGWYPFFVTLTVDPKMTDPETLWKEGREFRKYIRRLANISSALVGHPPPHKKTKEYGYRPESDYVTYAGVVEHGKSQEHHHGHFMIWMREIPSHWKIDPNAGRMRQYRHDRECKPMRTLWPWAIASQKPALYFRTKGDIWSKLGHCVPNDKKTGLPIKINQVEAVGNYVTKYMQKGDKQWNHRMKCTRNLGMKMIQEFVNKLNRKTLEALSWKPANSKSLHSVSSIHSVPQGIIRSLAKRRIFVIDYKENRLDLRTLMKTNYEHYQRMLKSVRDGARPDRMPSQEFYDWVQQHQPETKGYCETRLIRSHKLLSKLFPRQKHKVSPVVLGANEIGFTQCI